MKYIYLLLILLLSQCAAVNIVPLAIEDSNKNRNIMVNEGIWDEFQMQKANVIKYALENETDTMFLDSDIIFFNPI